MLLNHRVFGFGGLEQWNGTVEWTGLERWNDRGHVSALIAMVSHAQRCRKTIIMGALVPMFILIDNIKLNTSE